MNGDGAMGKIPQLVVKGDLLPEVWEASIINLWNEGLDSSKESYKVEEEKDMIKEASMLMVVRTPLEQPMVHMGYEGVMSLDVYVDDVIKGTKDYLIGSGYDYTYHKQLFEFEVEQTQIDQIEQVIKRLKKASFSNRAQAITWMPWKHYDVDGPPCLQRVWCKVIDGELEMHTHWRSRDAYHAAFANMFAFIHLQKFIADKLGVKIGQYVDHSDSYHIYGQHFDSVRKFLKAIETIKNKETRWVNKSFLDRYVRGET